MKKNGQQVSLVALKIDMFILRNRKPMKNVLYLLFIVLTFISCKHNHEVSEALKKAHSIQLEALEISKEVDTLIQQNVSDMSAVKRKKDEWLKNMIEIEGIEHDHSNCNHNHSRMTYAVTDEEMIEVQRTWKDSIIQIKNDILALNK